MKKNTLLTQQEHSQMNELHQEYTSLEQEQTYKIVIKLQEQDIDNTKFIALLEKLNYSENVTFLDITLGSNNITDDLLVPLMQKIGEMKNLTHLVLDFKNN